MSATVFLVQVRGWQIINAKAGTVENLVDLSFAKVRALASCEAASESRTNIVIDRIVLEVFGRQFNLEVKRDGSGFLDWVYVDDRIRITTGNRGSTFVHERD